MYYAFDFITEDGVIDHVDVGAFHDDAGAIGAARRALGCSTKTVAVRVWRDQECVAEAKRYALEFAAPLTAQGSADGFKPRFSVIESCAAPPP